MISIFPTAHRQAAPTIRLAIALSLSLAAVLGPAPQARLQAQQPGAPANESQKVEQFLSALGLVDLQILHLENQLEKAAGAPKDALAKRLADLYAERLMSASSDPATYARVEQQIRPLLERFPEANTTSLQVMLLQADFTRAETRLHEWLVDRSKQDAFDDARSILQRIAPALNRHQQELNASYDELRKKVNNETDEEKIQALEQDAVRRAAVTGRATFFAGWANYYQGLTEKGDASADALKIARSAFRRLLDIDPKTAYADLTADDLGLESIWRSRALVGLAQTETALGNMADSARLFSFLEDVSVPLAIRDLSASYRLQAMLYVGKLDDALVFARQQAGSLGGHATQGKISFCVALLGAGFETSSPNEQTKELGELGVRALARLGRVDYLKTYLREKNIQAPDDPGFYLQWLRGEQQFDLASASKANEDYSTALATFKAALKSPEAKTDVLAAGECRYKAALCLYHLGELQQAAVEFEQAIPVLKASPGDSALNAAWSAFVAYYRLAAGGDPRHASSAIAMLERIKTDFPRSDKAKQADTYIARLKQAAGSTADSIANWSRVAPTDPNYTTALYEIARLQQQGWKEAAERGAGQSTAARQAFDAIAKYLQAKGAEGGRKLELLLLGYEIAVGEKDTDAAGAYLAQAAQQAAGLGPEVSAMPRFHYLALKEAQSKGSQAAVETHSNWLMENAPGSPYEGLAVILTAQKIDRDIKAKLAASQPVDYEQAYQVYKRLAQVTGESAEAMQSQKNARVANSRLATYEMETGRSQQAARRLERLLQTDPTNKDYLLRTAEAAHAAGEYAQSLEVARTLQQGLPKNTAEWYQAKWLQIDSLRQVDAANAKIVLRQFRVLYPKVPFAPWEEKFKQLDQQLGG
ncbi:tetratricopeptide repeat protein [Lignipirellula cremea]|uniref:Tetratricopeptide repeat protein n=1 Tax=Lignipirellula cremea TaxID=2528010 RepID=A0A518DSS9_9BACT|nr:tetratricopeptide repeat protein [Lignipirellula cremea]QDU94896.1 hypothetical protein Pla8534_27040 [Lignipirellula cremea]